MNYEDHTFDWKGFKTFLKILIVFFAVFCIGKYVYIYAQTSIISQSKENVKIESSAVVPDEVIDLPVPVQQRFIKTKILTDVLPVRGKFIMANLSEMKIYLYEDGIELSSYPIITKGKPGTAWETPSGLYSILTKENTHFSTIGKVYMPYAMQFYGNYFIHGWTYYPDGTPVSASFSGGCIKLSTEDAEKVFNFSEKGTGLFVYDQEIEILKSSIILNSILKPEISAQSYLVGDLDNGDVFLEKEYQQQLPIASVTKLVTALVANETISFDKKIYIDAEDLLRASSTLGQQTFLVGDILFPLLMESNNFVADNLAKYYGFSRFVDWMNLTTKALNMTSTHFVDPSGIFPENISTAEDLFKLSRYLVDKKSFILGITKTNKKTISSFQGQKFDIKNYNIFSDIDNFIGGKVGHTTSAKDVMLSVFRFKINGEDRNICIIVLKSDDNKKDIEELLRWFTLSVVQ